MNKKLIDEETVRPVLFEYIENNLLKLLHPVLGKYRYVCYHCKSPNEVSPCQGCGRPNLF